MLLLFVCIRQLKNVGIIRITMARRMLACWADEGGFEDCRTYVCIYLTISLDGELREFIMYIPLPNKNNLKLSHRGEIQQGEETWHM